MSVATMFRNAMLISALSLLSSIMGFGRESYTAYLYGSSGLTDAFYVAAVVPEMIAGWISYTLTNSLIPVLKKEMLKDNRSANELIRSIFFDASLGLLLLLILGWQFETIIVRGLAPGFSLIQRVETVHMLKIMLLGIVFSGLSGVLWGIHNAHEKYFYPAVVGVANNVLLITAIVFLHSKLGIFSLAWGYLIGVAGKFLIQFLPLLSGNKNVGHTRFKTWHPAIKEILHLIGPIFISVGVGSISGIVDRFLASSLPPGSFTDLNYAMKIGMLPGTLLGMPLATALYTRFVSFNLSPSEQNERAVIIKTFSLSLFFALALLPAFVGYSVPIMALLFQRGAFTPHDTIIASRPLVVYGVLGLLYLISPALTHFFYARQESKFITKVSTVVVLVNIIVSVFCVRLYGIVGLVIGNGVSQGVYVGVLFWTMHRRKNWLIHRSVIQITMNALPPSLPIFFAFWLVQLLRPAFHLNIQSIFGLSITYFLGLIFLFIYMYRFRDNLISRRAWSVVTTLRTSK